MKLKRPKRFLPLANIDPFVVFLIPRNNFTVDLVSRALAAVDPQLPPGALLSHADLLLNRSRGELTFKAYDADLPTKNMVFFKEQWGQLLTYESDFGDTIHFKWSMDVFNPQNAECKMPIYDNQFEYLEFIVRSDTLQPFDPLDDTGRFWGPYESLLQRHAALNRALARIYEAVHPFFAFGSAVGQLRRLTRCYHYARADEGFSPTAQLWEYWWQFAIYPPALRPALPAGLLSFLESNPNGVIVDEDDEKDEEERWERGEQLVRHYGQAAGIFVEKLADGGHLVWTPKNSPVEVDEWCAAMTSLRSIMSIETRPTP